MCVCVSVHKYIFLLSIPAFYGQWSDSLSQIPMGKFDFWNTTELKEKIFLRCTLVLTDSAFSLQWHLPHDAEFNWRSRRTWYLSPAPPPRSRIWVPTTQNLPASPASASTSSEGPQVLPGLQEKRPALPVPSAFCPAHIFPKANRGRAGFSFPEEKRKEKMGGFFKNNRSVP